MNTIVLAGNETMKAVEEALGCCIETSLYPDQIYIECISMVHMFNKEDPRISWRYRTGIEDIKGLISSCPNAEINYISRSYNSMANDS